MVLLMLIGQLELLPDDAELVWGAVSFLLVSVLLVLLVVTGVVILGKRFSSGSSQHRDRLQRLEDRIDRLEQGSSGEVTRDSPE